MAIACNLSSGESPGSGWGREQDHSWSSLRSDSPAVLAARARASWVTAPSTQVTVGADNALAVWIYDSADDRPRLLKGRRGPPGPVRHLMCAQRVWDFARGGAGWRPTVR